MLIISTLILEMTMGKKKTVKEVTKSLVQKLSRPLVTWQVGCRSPASGDVTTGDGVVRGGYSRRDYGVETRH